MQRLRIVGLGVRNTDQVTLEGLRQLRMARLVLHLAGANDRLDDLGLPSVESLNGLYLDGARDVDNYDRLVETVVERLAEFKDVALLLPGHPRFGVSIASRLEQVAEASGFTVHASAGISSFDSMTNDLALDPLERGTVVVDANRLLLFDQELNPEFNTFIYHVCSVGTSATNLSEPSRDNRLALLQTKLSGKFPADTRVQLIESAANADGTARVVQAELAHLADLLPQVNFNSTLFVPAISPRRVDRQILHLLDPRMAQA